tara:strand:- start:2550 stop:3449 length:900 start_codon:yes stop_codon:yes gene_type:complete
MSEKVFINEVGLRDGLQNLDTFISSDGKLALCRSFIDAGLKEIEVTSFVSHKAVPQMSDADRLFSNLPDLSDVDFSALVPNIKGYERAREAGAKRVALVVATTETFNQRNINMTFSEAVSISEKVIALAQVDGVRVRTYISGSFVCPYEGIIPVNQVLDLTERLLAAGTDEVGIADTTGASNPAHCQKLFSAVTQRWGPERFSAHFHDTRAMGLVLAWIALQEGIRRFDSSIGGLGGCPFAPGAAGNLATEDLVFMLNQSGYKTDINFDRLLLAIATAEQLTGKSLGGRIMPWWTSQDK